MKLVPPWFLYNKGNIQGSVYHNGVKGASYKASELQHGVVVALSTKLGGLVPS